MSDTEVKRTMPKRLKRKGVDPEKKKETNKKVGRPKIWTPEKIEEEKERKRQEKEEKLIQEIDAKIDLRHKLKPKETKKVLAKRKKTKELIKQKSEKGLSQTPNLNVLNTCEHVLALDVIVLDKAIVSCKKCSAASEMHVESWAKYVRLNKKEM